MRRACVLLLGSAVLLGPALPWACAAAAQAMVGDLIVKFRAVPAPGAAQAAQLSNELGVPLRFVQLTSGQEALLAVDRTALAALLAQRARRQPGITRARLQPQPRGGLPSQTMVLRLEVRAGTPLESLAPSLAVAGVAPVIEASGAGAALLHLDVDALTQALLARLAQRPEIEYAQANRLLRPVR